MNHMVGKVVPEFTSTAVVNGEILKDFTLGQFRDKNHVVLFFYPMDFTFVCPTELHALQTQLTEFRKLGVEVVACSTDSHHSHLAWLRTAKKDGGIAGVSYPIIADYTKTISAQFGVLQDNGIALRGAFLIDRKGVVQAQWIHNLSLGRNVDEILRTVQALRHTEETGDVCPANWANGQKALKANLDAVKAYLA